jgi:uncharacterized protein Yka (UPF0111/DUF47 family)
VPGPPSDITGKRDVPLIPRDEGFFKLFNQLAAKMKQAAELLRSMFAAPERITHFVAEIKKVEHEADAVIAEIMMRLDRSFITPLDREDIYRLAQELDTVVDLIDGTARRAVMFHLRESRPHAVRLAGMLQQAVDELEQSVTHVKDRRSVAQHTLAIKKYEEAGDSAYSEAIGELFEGSPDAIDVIKWKEVYDTLEDALDRCQTASIVLESISLKHS